MVWFLGIPFLKPGPGTTTATCIIRTVATRDESREFVGSDDKEDQANGSLDKRKHGKDHEDNNDDCSSEQQCEWSRVSDGCQPTCEEGKIGVGKRSDRKSGMWGKQHQIRKDIDLPKRRGRKIEEEWVQKEDSKRKIRKCPICKVKGCLAKNAAVLPSPDLQVTPPPPECFTQHHKTLSTRPQRKCAGRLSSLERSLPTWAMAFLLRRRQKQKRATYQNETHACKMR